MIAFDKTGTITSGKPAVEQVIMTKGQDESAFTRHSIKLRVNQTTH